MAVVKPNLDVKRFVFHLGSGRTVDAVNKLKLDPGIMHIVSESDKIGISTQHVSQAYIEKLLKDLVPEGSKHRIHDEGGHFVRMRIQNKLKQLEDADGLGQARDS